MKMRNRLFFIIGLLVTLLACSTFQPPPTPGIVESLRKIAFVSTRDGNPEVYIMNSDGSEQTRLTNNLAEDRVPVWSPSGEQIAFISKRDGNDEIYIMNVDGSSQTRVTHTNANDYIVSSYTWSPDGKKVAFTLDVFTTMAPLGTTIYVINIDGTGLTQLTNAQGINHSPSWSPDGNLISFVSEDDGNFEIYTMNTDGSNKVCLTNNESSDYAPVWSPDSKQIAFTSYQDGAGEVYIVNVDGSGQSRITDNKEVIYPLAWLPTNELIVYRLSQVERNIYLMTIDGSKQTVLAKMVSDASEVVSPDGTQVAFVTREDGDYEIYIVNLRGSTQLRLTDNSVDDYHPAWQP